MRIAIVSLGLLATVATVRADEETLSPKELPKAVRAAVKAKFPEAKVTGAAKEVEDGKTVYEVSLKDDDEAVDLLLSAKGKILEVEKTIPAKKLPKPVASAIKAKFPKAEIKKAEQVVKYEEDEDDDEEEADDDDDDEGTKSFEVILSAEGKEDVEVKLSPKGKILAEEDEAEGDEAKAKAKKGEDGDKKAKAKKDKDEDEDDEKEVKSKKKDGDKKAKAKKDKDEDEDDEKDEKTAEGKKKDKD